MDKSTVAKYGYIMIACVLIAILVVGAPVAADRTAGLVRSVESDVEAYKVTLDPAGGKVKFDYILAIPNRQVGYLPNPSYEGKAFAGWYTESGERVTSQTVFTGSKNTTLYARWK